MSYLHELGASKADESQCKAISGTAKACSKGTTGIIQKVTRKATRTTCI